MQLFPHLGMDDKLSLLIKIAQQRSGLVLLDDLKQLHFSPSAITRLVSRGILRRVHRGMVYALSDEHLNFEAEIAAACFAVPESWASGVSAAQYWGIRRVPRDRVEFQ
jgi:predicted transcriptional regulator of viral defense system